MSEWPPTETALTDGTRVLFWDERPIAAKSNDTERYAGARWVSLPETSDDR